MRQCLLLASAIEIDRGQPLTKFQFYLGLAGRLELQAARGVGTLDGTSELLFPRYPQHRGACRATPVV